MFHFCFQLGWYGHIFTLYPVLAHLFWFLMLISSFYDLSICTSGIKDSIPSGIFGDIILRNFSSNFFTILFVNVYHSSSDFKKKRHSCISYPFNHWHWFLHPKTNSSLYAHDTIASFPFCPGILETQPQCLQLLEPSASHEMSWNHTHKQSWGTKPEPPFMWNTETNAVKGLKWNSIHAGGDKTSRRHRFTGISSALRLALSYSVWNRIRGEADGEQNNSGHTR